MKKNEIIQIICFAVPMAIVMALGGGAILGALVGGLGAGFGWLIEKYTKKDAK